MYFPKLLTILIFTFSPEITKLTLLLTGKMPKIHPPDTLTFPNTAFVKRTRLHLYLNKTVKQIKGSVLADLLTSKLTRTRTNPCRSPSRKTLKLKRTSCYQNSMDTDWNRTDLIPNFCLYLCQSHYLSAPAARACSHPACLQICV